MGGDCCGDGMENGQSAAGFVQFVAKNLCGFTASKVKITASRKTAKTIKRVYCDTT